MRSPTVIHLAAVLLPAALSTHELRGAPELPALRVTVSRLSESRTTQTSAISGRGVSTMPGIAGRGQTPPSSLSLTLTISGDSLPDNVIVLNAQVAKAVDNLDRLLPPASGGWSYRISPSSLARGTGSPPGQPLNANMNFGGTDRDADSLKSVEGSIELYVPTEANGAIVRIANIKSHPGRVENPALARAGIEFRFLGDKASADEARSLITGSQSTIQIQTLNGYGIYYRDPSNRIVGYMLQDAAGTLIRSDGGGGGGGPNGMLYSHTLPSPMTDDTQLVIFLAAPEAIRTVPFRIENLLLP